MTQYTADALSAPHSQREMDMIEDDNAQKMHITVPPIMCSFEDTTHAYECGYRDGRRAAQPTAEVERLLRQRDQAEARYTKACGMLDRTHVRAEKAEAALAAMTAERDAAFAAGIEAAASVALSQFLPSSIGGDLICDGEQGECTAAAIRALATTNQRAALDRLVSERVAAELAKRGEPVASCRRCSSPMRKSKAIGQTFVEGTPDFPGDTSASTISAGGPGELIDCLKCEACGWSVTAPASAGVTVKPQACATDGCDRLSEVYFVRADVGSHYCGQCYLKVHGMEQSRLAALSPAEQAQGEG